MEEEQGHKKNGSVVSVFAAILANILVGVVKFIAAAISGSSAMISEGIHSIVDSGNGILVLFGMKRASKHPDVGHPFGYGKELYFWTMVVAVMIFALGGGVSMYEGIVSLRSITPETTLSNPLVNYVVIIVAAAIEGTSLSVALKNFNRARGDVRPFKFIQQAKDPSLFTVVLEDVAAETGLLIAFLGVFFSHLLNIPQLDSIASILIGLLLCCVAIILLHETKGLLIGEGLSLAEMQEAKDIIENNVSVRTCGRVLTLYLGPSDLLITADVTFDENATRDQIESSIDAIEQELKTRFPQTSRIFIEPENLKATEETAASDSTAVNDASELPLEPHI